MAKRKPAPPDKREIGQRIRVTRESAKMTAVSLAAASGVGLHHLYSIERGETMPTVGTLVGIGHALGKPVEWLITGREVRA